jgi:2,3-dihydroxybenzoate decarboxylase
LWLAFGGLFDRFPRAKLYGVKLAKPPSQYMKENFVVTTSGMCPAEPLACAISALGADRVMFAADYPFEATEEAVHFIDRVALAGKVRDDICFNNAARFLGLKDG